MIFHPIIPDGNPGDWLSPSPPVDSFFIDTQHGEAIWNDMEMDDLGDGDYTYPINPAFTGNEADLVEFRVTDYPDSNYLYFLIKLKGFEYIWQPILVITMDLDHVYGSGQAWVPQYADYVVDSLIFWEYAVVIWDGWVALLNSSFSNVTGPNSYASFNPDNEVIEVRLDCSYMEPKPWNTGGAYYSVMVGLQDFGNFREVDLTPSEWRGGGGVGYGEGHPDWVDPDIYDLGFVVSYDQQNDLNTYLFNPFNPNLSRPAKLRNTSVRFIPHPIPTLLCICGDLNSDNSVNYNDLTLLANYLFFSGAPPNIPRCADVNGDNSIDPKDFVYFSRYLLGFGNPPQCP